MTAPILTSFRAKLWLTGAVWGFFGLVVLIWVWADRVGPLPGSSLAMAESFGTVFPTVPDPASLFSYIASPVAATATVALASWILATRVSLVAGLLVPVAGAVVLASALLRDLLGPTPQALEFTNAHEATYPSGHVAYAAAVFGWLAVVAWRLGKRQTAAGLILLTCAMGAARILSGAHFSSDVAGGYALGLAWLGCIVLICDAAVARAPGLVGTLGGRHHAGAGRA
jgi:undecaprenyl-diphosphatase